MIKVDCPQKQTDRRHPFCQPSWLSFVKLNLYSNLNKNLMEANSNLNESLMKAIDMKFERNLIKND